MRINALFFKNKIYFTHIRRAGFRVYSIEASRKVPGRGCLCVEFTVPVVFFSLYC